MNISAQIRQSVHIITEYYENHLQPFFDAADDDLLWIGPAENQWMQGKATILAAFAQEDGTHHLTFTMRISQPHRFPAARMPARSF